MVRTDSTPSVRSVPSDVPMVSTDIPLPTSSQFPSSSLSSKIHQNIASLQSMRRAHRRILDLTSNESAEDPRAKFAKLDPTSIDIDDAERERRRLAMESARREPKPIEVIPGRTGRRRIPRFVEVSKVEAAEGIKRTTGEVLAHAGFEGESLLGVPHIHQLEVPLTLLI